MKKINLNVPINALGYGVVGYNLWKAINKKLDVTLWAIPDENRITLPCETSDEIIQQIRIDISKQDDYHPNAPCLKVWHENQLAHRVGKGEYFAMPFFEVNKFNQRRKSHLESADQIIVSSDWAKKVCLKNIRFRIPDIHVVPCGVDRSIFNEENSTPNQNKCIFFNCGKWEVRKGHDILHKAFKKAFSGRTDVELWMMSENPFLSPEESNSWKKLYEDSRIKLVPRVQYQEELAKIMGQTFCGVFPARAEGWNLEALEMMAMGKQLIITNYSAHTEFCNQNNSRLIDIVEEEPMYDGKWFVGDNGTWASLEGEPFDNLVEEMRAMYRLWQTGEVLNTEGIITSKELSWESMANRISNIIFGE